jgi:lysophospholipase L1-like esterase
MGVERRRLSWLAGPLLVLVTGVVIAAFAEVTARVAWHLRPDFVAPERPEEWRDLPVIKGLFEASESNVRGLYNGTLYETNSAGFVGPNRQRRRTRGTYRIAVVGDSITMGSGVLYEDTYSARLEASADGLQQYAGRKAEVLNFGLAGLSARWVVRRAATLGLQFNPDLIVYGYTLNDIEGHHYRRSVTKRYVNPAYYLDSRWYTLRYLGPWWNSAWASLTSPAGSYRFELEDNYFRNPPAWAEIETQFDRLSRIAESRGICVVLLIHTHLYALGALHPFKSEYAAVAEAGRKRGFHVVESYPYFKDLAGGDLWVYPRDPHPNARGHEILFEALQDGLREMPKACWSANSQS